MQRFDLGIIGLGAMGSAVAHHVAQTGARVLALDAHHPPHALGSSHGHTRIIREAYYEHPLYVPLVRRAYELWTTLEREAHATLLSVTGGIMAGPEHGPVFRGALESATRHGIAHEVMDARTLAVRFPMYRAAPGSTALYEHRAGVLFPEHCIEAHLAGATRGGADLHFDEPVLRWSSSSTAVRIESAVRTYTVDRAIVCAGAWLPGIAARMGLRIPLEVERQLSHWFEPVRPEDRAWSVGNCPVGLWEVEGGELFATLPDEGHGVKCGMHHAGGVTTPDTVDRTVSEAENAAARSLLAAFAPGAAGRLRDARVCLYTNTPDRHFIIDWIEEGRVLVLSPCSGHGFKFASAIGELAMQLVTTGRGWMDTAPFSLRRFA